MKRSIMQWCFLVMTVIFGAWLVLSLVYLNNNDPGAKVAFAFWNTINFCAMLYITVDSWRKNL